MPRYMMVAGVLFAALGFVLGLMAVFSRGIGFEVGAILLVGSVVAFGFGGVIRTLETGRGAPMAIPAPESVLEQLVKTENFPLTSDPTTPAAAAAIAEPSGPVDIAPVSVIAESEPEFESAPEPEPAQAESPIPEPEPALPEPQLQAEPAPVEEAAPASAEPQLFVVEERVIRNCAARVLSDGTVEAETEEGWMRFENTEHLDEYLDAMAPIKRL